MSQTIDRASVRAYVDRDWRLLRAHKRAYWRAQLERGGLAEALSIADQLRIELQERNPTWPSEHEREEDLDTHRRVAAALARTARASGPDRTTPKSATGEGSRPRRRAHRVR